MEANIESGAEVNKGGAPPYYRSPEELAEAIASYFRKHEEDKAAEKDNKLTVSGLAYHLGFESRQSFYDYEKRDQFSYIVKRARLFIESNYEGRLQGNNPTGSIFWLKNSGWSDKTEIDGKLDITANITYNGIEVIPPANQE